MFCAYFIGLTANRSKKKEKTLKEIIQSAKTIPGTRKYHFFKPINDCTLEAKITSLLESYTVVDIK